MSLFLYILGGIAVGVIASYFVFKIIGGKKEEKKDDGSFILIQNAIENLTKTVDNKLRESRQELGESVRVQFSESQRLIKDITEQITEVREGNKQVLSFTGELRNLGKILTSQKQRGNLGEAGLELMLSNALPPTAYKLQYKFNNGDIVDAIIQTKDGLIPVDAKFSLDNYNRVINEEDPERKSVLEKEFKNDLKKRIDETAKYIRPNEGTLPFALMFIPAEGIYYDLLVNEVGAIKTNTRNLIDYAHGDKKVIIVSPTTLTAYLSAILEGFRAFKIEESSKEIMKRVEGLRRHIKAYEEYHQKIGNSLSTTVNHFNSSNKELRKIDKDVLKITGESANIEQTVLDKPQREE